MKHVSNLSSASLKCFSFGEMDKPLSNNFIFCFLLKFLSRTSIRTFEAEKLQKNKHIQPQPKFGCSYKKKKRVLKLKL